MNVQPANLVTLQKEVFHRVSNNFQIIQSMIRLVSQDPSVTDVAGEMEQRIQLLSVAHNAQHCFDSAATYPIQKALPNLIAGVQRGGFLIRREVGHEVNCGFMSAQRTYAILHILIEAFRILDRSTARHIAIALSDAELSVSSDSDPLAVNKSTIALTAAFARDVGADPEWSETGLTLRLH